MATEQEQLTELLSVAEIVRRTGLSRDTIYRAIAAHELPTVQPGKRKFYVEAGALRQWIVSRSKAGEQEN